MYRRAFETFRQCFALIVFFAVVVETALFFTDASDFTVTLVPYALLALIFHRVVLMDEPMSIWGTPVTPQAGAKAWPIGRFLWRFVLFGFPLILVAFVILLSVLPSAPEDARGAAVVLSVLPLIVLFPIWAGLAGTMLPAAAIGGDATLKAAFRRSRGTFWRTFGRILVGPVLVTASLMILFGAWVIFLPTFAPSDGTHPLITIAVFSVQRILGLFAPLLTAVALCMAYKEAEALAENTP